MYDIIIVGAGPSGIFTALELTYNIDANILILDKGNSIETRKCPAKTTNLPCNAFKCLPCHTLCGWGGAGAFSDGKLTLSSDVGGILGQYVHKNEIASLIKKADDYYLHFGAPQFVFGENYEEIQNLHHIAAKNDLILIPAKIRHVGTEKCFGILKNMQEYLEKKVEIKFRTVAEEIITEDGEVKGVKTSNGDFYKGKYVILAPGREGSEWLDSQAKKLQIKTYSNPVDVGLRIEVPYAIMEPVTSVIYEGKFIFYSRHFDDKVRTFCMCPQGEVVTEYCDGITTVNGHSYADKKTNYTNFAILVSTSFTKPFSEPILYGKYLGRLANLLGGGVIVQRLGDLSMGRRSTYDRIRRGTIEPTLKTATPGDLSFVLPYRYLSDILEMIKALDSILPGIESKHTLLYGLELKFYSMRLNLTPNLETEIKNLFAIGDGAGISRGLIQASVSGIMVSQEIIKRLKRTDKNV